MPVDVGPPLPLLRAVRTGRRHARPCDRAADVAKSDSLDGIYASSGVDPTMSGLDRLLRVSAARGASTLYLSSDSRPSVRVDGELQVLEGEPVLSARDVESLLLTLMPERSHEALRTGAATEWICDIEGVGRVRCMSFRDHRGPGGVFRLMPTRSVSADQLGLPPAGAGAGDRAGRPGAGGRSALERQADADVGVRRLMNRTRRDHVITIEREINIVHERGSSFISQREVRGNDDDMLAAARAALREDPDVLVIEDLRTGALMNVALEAAAARAAGGRRLLGPHRAPARSIASSTSTPPEYRRQVQLALADSLRGVIVQVLLRKTGGGRRVGAGGAAEHSCGVERDRGRQDVAAGDGDRGRAALRHDADQRRARRAWCKTASSTRARPIAGRPIAPASSRRSNDTASTRRSWSDWLSDGGGRARRAGEAGRAGW